MAVRNSRTSFAPDGSQGGARSRLRRPLVRSREFVRRPACTQMLPSHRVKIIPCMFRIMTLVSCHARAPRPVRQAPPGTTNRQAHDREKAAAFVMTDIDPSAEIRISRENDRLFATLPLDSPVTPYGTAATRRWPRLRISARRSERGRGRRPGWSLPFLCLPSAPTSRPPWTPPAT